MFYFLDLSEKNNDDSRSNVLKKRNLSVDSDEDETMYVSRKKKILTIESDDENQEDVNTCTNSDEIDNLNNEQSVTFPLSTEFNEYDDQSGVISSEEETYSSINAMGYTKKKPEHENSRTTKIFRKNDYIRDRDDRQHVLHTPRLPGRFQRPSSAQKSSHSLLEESSSTFPFEPLTFSQKCLRKSAVDLDIDEEGIKFFF